MPEKSKKTTGGGKSRFKKGQSGNPRGRKKGVPNKVTQEVRELARALFDAEYWASARERLRDGKMAPAVESKLLAYAYGEPKQQHEHSGTLETVTRVVHEQLPDDDG